MTNLMKIETEVTMTSLELVDFINKFRAEKAAKEGEDFPSKGNFILLHKNFLSKVPEVLGEETSAIFLADLPDSYGRLQKAYKFPKREASLMAMSYSYDLQASVFDHMTKLETELQEMQTYGMVIPKSYGEALIALGNKQVTIEHQQHQLALAAPKVDFVDQYVDTTGKTTFRQLAKILQVNERRLRHFLKDNKIMYQLNDEWVGYSKYMKNGMLETVTGFNKDMCRSFTTTVFTPKGVNYVASYWKK